MPAPAETPERMVLFSDAVFAVIITVMVLDLKPPHDASWQSLLALWPTLAGYALSYLFIATVWINHHHLMRFARRVTPALLWGNFGHLFSISLLPFTTGWIAETRMSVWPVVAYAMVFAFVNATYLVLHHELFGDLPETDGVAAQSRRTGRRAWATLGAFLSAAVLSVWHPTAGLMVIVACMLAYLRYSDRINV